MYRLTTKKLRCPECENTHLFREGQSCREAVIEEATEPTVEEQLRAELQAATERADFMEAEMVDYEKRLDAAEAREKALLLQVSRLREALLDALESVHDEWCAGTFPNCTDRMCGQYMKLLADPDTAKAAAYVEALEMFHAAFVPIEDNAMLRGVAPIDVAWTRWRAVDIARKEISK